MVAAAIRCGTGRSGATLAAAMAILTIGVQRHDPVRRRLCRIEQGSAGERVAVIADIPAVGPLDHGNAGIVIDRNDAHRHAGQELPDDIRMPQRV